ncbi:MAG: dienelactone hydrolase family protein [Mycobacteriaceae bacterium]
MKTTTDVAIDTAEGPFEASLFFPSGEKGVQESLPGVVVLHDITGYGADIKKISQRVADAGYMVITPNLYSRGGPARCITRVFRELIQQRGRAIDDILAAKDFLKSQQDCTGSVGVIGFCMGGGFALVMSPKGFDASAPFYGAPLPLHINQALDNACPIVASLGKRDPLLIGAEKKLRQALEGKGVTNDIKAYSGVGHSFANELPLQSIVRIIGFGFNQEATDDAFKRVFSFFKTHLNNLEL